MEDLSHNSEKDSDQTAPFIIQIIQIIIFAIIACYILCFQTWCLSVQCLEGVADVHRYMPQTLDWLALSAWCTFYQKLKDAACLLKQLETYTLWSNAAEKRLKRSRMRLVLSCYSQEYQNNYGMTAKSGKPILGSILPMIFMNKMWR